MTAEHRSFCRVCPAECGIMVTVEGDRVVSVRGDRDDPVSRGYTCEKGRALPLIQHDPARLDHPTIDGRRSGWAETLDSLGSRLRSIAGRHGPHAIAFYTGNGAVFDAAGIATAHRLALGLGTRSRFSSETVDAPNKPLVAELMGGRPWLLPVADYRDARLHLLIGVNPVISHGHFNSFPDPVTRIREMLAAGEVWVLDPRRTETAKLATRHLAPRPGTDVAVLAHCVREILEAGADAGFLAAHASGLEGLRHAVQPWTRDRAASVSGLEEAELAELVEAIRRAGRVAAQTGTGVSMGPQANIAEWLTWALNGVTGSLDRERGIWFNPGYFSERDRRDWPPAPVPEGRPVPSRPEVLGDRRGQLPSAAMASEIETGEVRALVVVGGSPLTAFPNASRVREALPGLEVLAVLDVRAHELTRMASHVLPVAAQLERADLPGFVEPFQSCVMGRYTPAVVAPGAERRPMWWVLAELGRRLDVNPLPPGLDPDTATDDDVLRGQVGKSSLSFDGLRQRRIEVRDRAVFGWVTDRVLPAGRWNLAPEPLVEQLASWQPTSVDALSMIPRRQRRHFNSTLAEAGLGDRPDLLVNPSDAAARGLGDGAPARLAGPGGSLQVTVRLDPQIRLGAISLPHGWPGANVETVLGDDVLDPLTGMPVQSAVPVELSAP